MEAPRGGHGGRPPGGLPRGAENVCQDPPPQDRHPCRSRPLCRFMDGSGRARRSPTSRWGARHLLDGLPRTALDLVDRGFDQRGVHDRSERRQLPAQPVSEERVHDRSKRCLRSGSYGWQRLFARSERALLEV